MARVRISDGLRNKIREYVRNSEDYDTQAEFVKDAVRRLLDQKKDKEISNKEAIRQIVKEELGEEKLEK